MAKKQNEAATALGKLRWAGVSKPERTKQMAELARKRAEALTDERKSEIGKLAVAAREKKRAAKKKSARRKPKS